MNKTFEGKSNIKATIICDSISPQGVRLTTMELEYPRITHSELLTHRMFSRNAASSRAIPFEKMLKQLNGKPVRFGANQAGMQDSGEHDAKVKLWVWDEFDNPSDVQLYTPYEGSFTPEEAWEMARDSAVEFSKAFSEAGFHKQAFNRLTEPFQMMKVLVSATEWNNFFWLRDDLQADPTLEELAKTMKLAYADSTPQLLKAGQWHLPYIDAQIRDGKIFYFESEGSLDVLELEDAIKVSGARCAAVSYRNVDYNLEKSKQVYARLVESEKIHGSALEHQATPIKDELVDWGNIVEVGSVNIPDIPCTWQDGITHMDKNSDLWSGNFKGFIQARKLIAGENHSENV